MTVAGCPAKQPLLPAKLPTFDACSRVLPGDERIHESVLVAEGHRLTGPPDASVRTLYDLLLRGIRVSGNGELVGERKGPRQEYSWTRYEQLAEHAQQIGSALVFLGVPTGTASRVGIAGVNCTEYMTATFALVSYSIVNVPLYHNYKFEALKEIVNVCELRVIFCDTVARARQFEAAADELPLLEKIVVFHCENDQLPNGPGVTGRISLYEWKYLLKLGANNLLPVVPPEPKDVYIICNTSGTTGRPKGVELSHRAILAAMAGLYHQWCVEPNCLVFDKDDTYLSFLSPAHIYEQLIQAFVIYIGGRLGLYSGDISKLLDDMAVLRPTIVSLVPRLLNKFHDGVWAKANASGCLRRLLFRVAMNAKLRQLKRGIANYDSIWDRLVLRKARAAFGGRLRLVTSGGAPITAKVMNFSKVFYGCPLVEGYGQSECSAAGTLSMPSDTGNGHVGGPAPWAQVKLTDVPELGYRSADDKGEVCFRGAAVMNGYFRDPEQTTKALDEEGWLHTGDIGQWLPNGSLRIIDRKNNFFKLAQGDFVSPEQVENVYGQHPVVNQIFVDGKTTESFLVAIVVVNLSRLETELAQPANSRFRSLIRSNEDLLANNYVREFVVQELRIFGASKGLSSLEQIKATELTTTEFTVEEGLLTPTLKLKRQQMRNKFADVIDKLYAETNAL